MSNGGRTRAARPVQGIGLALAVAVALTGCSPNATGLAQEFAQPDTRPLRSTTAFSGSLRCMDDLLAKSGRRGIRITSTDIPDLTRGVSVGADDMLITAFSQMNRRSGSYVFVDQPRQPQDGKPVSLRSDEDRDFDPSYYIRGSISQLDSNTSDTDFRSSGGRAPDLDGNNGLTVARINGRRALSVITVDMHLVRYSDRRVLQGASVANSMVVVQRSITGDVTGLVDLAGVGLTLEIERIESRSQAVRNLIELGVIELIGRHAGVPYWNCLARLDTDAARNQDLARTAMMTSPEEKRRAAQQALVSLGYLKEPLADRLDRKTRQAIARYQADRRMVVTGEPSHVLLRRLEEDLRTKRARPNSATGAAIPVPMSSGTRRSTKAPASSSGPTATGSGNGSLPSGTKQAASTPDTKTAPVAASAKTSTAAPKDAPAPSQQRLAQTVVTEEVTTTDLPPASISAVESTPAAPTTPQPSQQSDTASTANMVDLRNVMKN